MFFTCLTEITCEPSRLSACPHAINNAMTSWRHEWQTNAPVQEASQEEWHHQQHIAAARQASLKDQEEQKHDMTSKWHPTTTTPKSHHYLQTTCLPELLLSHQNLQHTLKIPHPIIHIKNEPILLFTLRIYNKTISDTIKQLLHSSYVKTIPQNSTINLPLKYKLYTIIIIYPQT